jgi:hypothetical protein
LTFQDESEIGSLTEMKLDNYWWVYTLECVPTGRTYVGLTGKPNPAWRWSEHIIQMRNGISLSPRLQQEWNAYPHLRFWRFGTIDRVEGKVAGNQLEATTTVALPEDKRLNEKIKSSVTLEKRQQVEKLLAEGRRYVDIVKEVGVSMGWVSHVKHALGKRK